MQVRLELFANGCLDIDFEDVKESERGRIANMDIEIMKALGSLTHFPIAGGGTRHRYRHERATLEKMALVKDVLAGFALVPDPNRDMGQTLQFLVERSSLPAKNVVLK